MPKELALCRKLGLGAIVAPEDSSTLKEFRGKAFSEKEIVRRVRKMIDEAGDEWASFDRIVFHRTPPVADLPMLPGAVIQSLTSLEPMMIGEFKNAAGEIYVMVVNLSLERSLKFTLKTLNANERIEIVSAVNASLSTYDEKVGLWLVAGSGALLTLGK